MTTATKAIQSYWENFVSLFFPPLCVACNETLVHQEYLICASCRFHLPLTDHYLFRDNDAVKRFWGKAEVAMAASYLSFVQSSLVQTILHELKYKRNYRVGHYLGTAFGEQLLESPYFKGIDIVIPIPLHQKKKRQRGYNQSEYIANGIAQAIGVPMVCSSLIRKKYTASQTNKSGIDRFDNMENVFDCSSPENLKGKHILLIDDVLTTGATLSSAIHVLQGATDCKISVATLAIA